MKKTKRKHKAMDFTEQSKNWNQLRKDTRGAHTQTEWSKKAASYNCKYVNIVTKALTESPFFLSDGADRHPKYLFTKPVTRVFIQDVIESRVKKRSDAGKSILNTDKRVDTANGRGGHVCQRYVMRVMENPEWERIITEREFEFFSLFADTWKDAQLNTIYKINRSEFTVTPYRKEVSNE